MNVTLYKTTTCPQCKVVKIKLERKGIPYEEISDLTILEEKGITAVPTLEVDGVRMSNIREISDWVAEQEDRING